MSDSSKKGAGFPGGMGFGGFGGFSAAGAPAGSSRAILSSGEKARLMLMLAGTVFLIVAMAMLMTGRLEPVLSVFLGGGDSTEQMPDGEESEDDGLGGMGQPDPDAENWEKPRGGALPIPRTVEDPGDEEDLSWKDTDSYRLYREYMARLLPMTDEELAAEVDPKVEVWSHVWRKPGLYKGKVIRLRGMLVRRKAKEDIPEDLPPGAEVQWEVQIYNYGSKHIYTLDLIGDCPESLMNKPVAIDAIFFDVIEYQARRNVIRRSCFFIGKNVKGFELRDPSSLFMLFVLGIPILIVLVFAFLESRKVARFESAHVLGNARKQYDARRRLLARREAAAPATTATPDSPTDAPEGTDTKATDEPAAPATDPS